MEERRRTGFLELKSMRLDEVVLVVVCIQNPL